MRVLDAGCGNGLYLGGLYLRGLRDRQVTAVGCDLSMGMLQAAAYPALLNADVTALPLRDGAVDVVLAVHMLYHVPSREAAIRELRRVVTAGGACIAVTNGARHTRLLRDLVERAVREETPARPWGAVAEDVRRRVQAVIDDEGAFITTGDLAAFICR